MVWYGATYQGQYQSTHQGNRRKNRGSSGQPASPPVGELRAVELDDKASEAFGKLLGRHVGRLKGDVKQGAFVPGGRLEYSTLLLQPRE